VSDGNVDVITEVLKKCYILCVCVCVYIYMCVCALMGGGRVRLPQATESRAQQNKCVK
jgi:hypothetical protein